MTITSTRTTKSRVITETKRPSKLPSVIFPKGTANTSDTLTPPNSDPFPVVRVTEDRKVVATSRDVANYFGKLHKHVLDAIDGLLAAAPRTEPNFRPSEYTDPTGRKLRMFVMDRDGFTLLAMGFNGEKALKFKLDYIDAFNEAIERLALLEKAREVPALPRTYLDALRALVSSVEQAEKLAEENEVLLIENQELHQTLDFVSLQEWAGRRRIYLNASERGRLSGWASRIAVERGITLSKEPRVVDTAKGPVEATVNVYPIELLDEVRSILRIRLD